MRLSNLGPNVPQLNGKFLRDFIQDHTTGSSDTVPNLVAEGDLIDYSPSYPTQYYKVLVGKHPAFHPNFLVPFLEVQLRNDEFTNHFVAYQTSAQQVDATFEIRQRTRAEFEKYGIPVNHTAPVPTALDSRMLIDGALASYPSTEYYQTVLRILQAISDEEGAEFARQFATIT